MNKQLQLAKQYANKIVYIREVFKEKKYKFIKAFIIRNDDVEFNDKFPNKFSDCNIILVNEICNGGNLMLREYNPNYCEIQPLSKKDELKRMAHSQMYYDLNKLGKEIFICDIDKNPSVLITNEYLKTKEEILNLSNSLINSEVSNKLESNSDDYNLNKANELFKNRVSILNDLLKKLSNIEKEERDNIEKNNNRVSYEYRRIQENYIDAIRLLESDELEYRLKNNG